MIFIEKDTFEKLSKNTKKELQKMKINKHKYVAPTMYPLHHALVYCYPGYGEPPMESATVILDKTQQFAIEKALEAEKEKAELVALRKLKLDIESIKGHLK